MSTPSRCPHWPCQDSSGPDWLERERDGCGVGFLARLDGQPSHWLLQQALRGLACMEHRGGCGGDRDSGDGAGVLCAIPWLLLETLWPAVAALPDGNIPALGMVFLPRDAEARSTTRRLCEEQAAQLGLHSHGWRVVPVDRDVLGPMAAASCPVIEQWLLSIDERHGDQEALERLLFRCRRRIGAQLGDVLGTAVSRHVSFASLSTRTVVYKGMVRSEVLPVFYRDLQDERFAVPYAVYHRRFSTNTLPRWPLAQPMRLLGHNGEINTLLGNINWALAAQDGLKQVWEDAASDLHPVVNPAFSDSANLDGMLELMVRSGRPVIESLMTLVPEAFQQQPELEGRQQLQDFYAYWAGIQEAWDGPALLAFTDGRWIGACLDRNGLRPARYCVTRDGLVVMGTETGVVELDEAAIVEKGRLGPGQMLAVDLEKGRLLRNWEVKEEAASRYPYGQWLQLRQQLAPQAWCGEPRFTDLELLQLQTAVGFTAEALDLIIEDMAGKRKEPTVCMGDD
ncbi:MAG: glutamate synthase subunit alpha, partial [Synechococcus sp. SB0672_bin_10]|nr:glutamate synthase subunit alpha [Synechococcus sp. SB0672_bin_10]